VTGTLTVPMINVALRCDVLALFGVIVYATDDPNGVAVSQA